MTETENINISQSPAIVSPIANIYIKKPTRQYKVNKLHEEVIANYQLECKICKRIPNSAGGNPNSRRANDSLRGGVLA